MDDHTDRRRTSSVIGVFVSNAVALAGRFGYGYLASNRRVRNELPPRQ